MVIEIVDLPIKNGDVPWFFVCLPERIIVIVVEICHAADVSPTFTQIPRHPEALSADAIDQVLVEGAVDEERRMRHIEDLRGPRVVSFGTPGSLVME